MDTELPYNPSLTQLHTVNLLLHCTQLLPQLQLLLVLSRRSRRLRRPRSITNKPLTNSKSTRPRIRRAMVVILIDNRVDHDGLFVDCDCGIGRDCDPIVCNIYD